jgi:hypothetical protein
LKARLATFFAQLSETCRGGEPKLTKKARVAPQRAHVAPSKAKSGKKASPAKKAPKGVLMSQTLVIFLQPLLFSLQFPNPVLWNLASVSHPVHSNRSGTNCPAKTYV